MERWRFLVRGIVQGVGFRPFVYNLATGLELSGWVLNTSNGVLIEVEGNASLLKHFQERLREEKPESSLIDEWEVSQVPLRGQAGFQIKESHTQFGFDTTVPPDRATCAECLEEIKNPENRRYQYPFTNCTNCGPRFSVIQALPYDRHHTTMKDFEMCSDCRREYNDPSNRRFHAQANACPQCGPQLELWDAKGSPLAVKLDALHLAAESIQAGKILALKGMGGFQLMVDARNEDRIQELRFRKRRGDKPFALMYPNMQALDRDAEVSDVEKRLLLSPEAPIVLVKRRRGPLEGDSPRSPYLGVMLPYTPLHHLLLDKLQIPVIATSGNRSEEPICIDEKEALRELEGVADVLLVHNRAISCCVDDSLVQVVNGRKQVLRRARGYSTLPIQIDYSLPPALSVGGQQKSTFALAKGKRVVMSQHIGDLDSSKAMDHFSKEIQRQMDLYGVVPERVVADEHPEYFSTQFASTQGKALASCQHHLAHVYSCMAEKRLSPPLLGVAWDGTGYGHDQTVWGGEFFRLSADHSVQRIASLRSFPLLCGERAVREPRLAALGLLFNVFGDGIWSQKALSPMQTFSEQDLANLQKMLHSGFRILQCSSMGRLFDGVSSLLGLTQISNFEGQAAMELQYQSEGSVSVKSYPFDIDHDTGRIDWGPMIRGIIEDLHRGKAKADLAAMFHNTLVDMLVEVAVGAGEEQVVLSGGVFQNRVLTEKAIRALTDRGHQAIWHEDIPPNDGGISLGQIYSLKGAGVCV